MMEEERVMKMIWKMMSNLSLVLVVLAVVAMMLMMILRAAIAKVTNAI